MLLGEPARAPELRRAWIAPPARLRSQVVDQPVPAVRVAGSGAARRAIASFEASSSSRKTVWAPPPGSYGTLARVFHPTSAGLGPEPILEPFGAEGPQRVPPGAENQYPLWFLENSPPPGKTWITPG